MTIQPGTHDDLHFRASANHAYNRLADLDRGKAKPLPWSSDDIDRAKRDAMSAIARDMPDPATFAWHMPGELRQFLLRAYVSRSDAENNGCWRLPDDPRLVPILRGMGLVSFDKVPFLGDFGIRVLKELRKDEG